MVATRFWNREQLLLMSYWDLLARASSIVVEAREEA